jgi:hypothetical protein
MRTFSRALARWDMLRVAVAVLALSWIAVLASYIYGAALTNFTLDGALAAAAGFVLAAAGFMYAWREPAPLDR